LVKQTQVNSKKQFLESQDFQAAVTEAVIDNQGAHNTMADYLFSDSPGINGVILALADAFYEAAIDEPASAGPEAVRGSTARARSVRSGWSVSRQTLDLSVYPLPVQASRPSMRVIGEQIRSTRGPTEQECRHHRRSMLFAG
jgi:hypothetical protein